MKRSGMFFGLPAPALKRPAVIVMGLLLASVSGRAAATQDLPNPRTVTPPADRQVFGKVHLTSNEVARLYFSNVPELNTPPVPVVVELQFVDGAGNTLLRREPAVVPPGETISLELPGDGLDLPTEGGQGGVLAIATILSPQARGLATLEIADSETSSRFVLHDRTGPFGPFRAREDWFVLGPVSLIVGEVAKLTVANNGTSNYPYESFPARMAFKDPKGDVIAQKSVTIARDQSESLEFSNTTVLTMGISGFVYMPQNATWAAEGTLEIFDIATGRRRTILHRFRPPGGGPTGGGGY